MSRWGDAGAFEVNATAGPMSGCPEGGFLLLYSWFECPLVKVGADGVMASRSDFFR